VHYGTMTYAEHELHLGVFKTEFYRLRFFLEFFQAFVSYYLPSGLILTRGTQIPDTACYEEYEGCIK
jgi:hypothetical protein